MQRGTLFFNLMIFCVVAGIVADLMIVAGR